MTCWRYGEPEPRVDRVSEPVKVSDKHSSPSRSSSEPLGQAGAGVVSVLKATSVAASAASPAATTAGPGLGAAASKRRPPLNMYPCSLSKSLSEECEDLGVDRPSTRELFPDTDLFLDSNLSPSNSQDASGDGASAGGSASPEPPDKKKKFPLHRSFSSQKSDFGCEGAKEERKQNGEVAIDAITAGVALASEVTAASPLPVLASSITSSRDDASSPDASMLFMHPGRVTTYGRRRDAKPVRDEWESEPLRAVPTSDVDDDFWHEPLVDDKDESLLDLDGHCDSPASNGTDPLALARVSSVAAAVAAAVVAKPTTTTSMTTRRGALKRKDVNDLGVDATKRDTEKKTDKKVKRSVPSRSAGPVGPAGPAGPAGLAEPDEEEAVDEKRARPKRTAMNRTEVFPRDAKKRASEEGPWREAATPAGPPPVALAGPVAGPRAATPTPPTAVAATVRRTSLRARLPGQPGSPATSVPATADTATVVAVLAAQTPTTKTVTKVDRNPKKSKGSKPIKGVALKKK